MRKVLVIGDSCQDIFNYGVCNRLCPEAPVPVFNPTKMIINGGMSINVFENLKSLKIDCDIVTNDHRPIKTRYVDEVSNQMLLRVDKKDVVKRIEEKRLKSIDFSKYYAIVISDYNKGFLDEEDIYSITNSHSLTFLDTKKEIKTWAMNTNFIKINENEYNRNLFYFKNHHTKDLIVTLGKNGAMLNREEIFPITGNHDIKDLCGAGDTFFAGLVADFINNNDIRSAIVFANKCASWAVTQKGVSVMNLINEIK